MMLHCPSCGELCNFQIRTCIDYDPQTGWTDENYAVCDNCLTAIDAADLDRQMEQENQDDEEGKKNGTTGNH